MLCLVMKVLQRHDTPFGERSVLVEKRGVTTKPNSYDLTETKGFVLLCLSAAGAR